MPAPPPPPPPVILATPPPNPPPSRQLRPRPRSYFGWGIPRPRPRPRRIRGSHPRNSWRRPRRRPRSARPCGRDAEGSAIPEPGRATGYTTARTTVPAAQCRAVAALAARGGVSREGAVDHDGGASRIVRGRAAKARAAAAAATVCERFTAPPITELAESVLYETTSVPVLSMPPPNAAAFPLMVDSVTVSVCPHC